MNRVICGNGHYFDLERFASCPVCGNENYALAPFGTPKPAAAAEEALPATTLLDERQEQAVDYSAPLPPVHYGIDELAPTEMIRPEEQARLGIFPEHQQTASPGWEPRSIQDPSPTSEPEILGDLDLADELTLVVAPNIPAEAIAQPAPESAEEPAPEAVEEPAPQVWEPQPAEPVAQAWEPQPAQESVPQVWNPITQAWEPQPAQAWEPQPVEPAAQAWEPQPAQESVPQVWNPITQAWEPQPVEPAAQAWEPQPVEPAAQAWEPQPAQEPVPQVWNPITQAWEPQPAQAWQPQPVEPAAQAWEPQPVEPAAQAWEPQPAQAWQPQPVEPAAQAWEPQPVEPAPAPVEEPAAPEQDSALQAAVKATGSQRTSSLSKTVAYYSFDDEEPPVGWLVCVRGKNKGRAFECKAGRNLIGRNREMDVCLEGEPTVSRESHATLIYEPLQRKFYLQAGTNKGLTYVNGEMLFDHRELEAYDKITLGSVELVFLPLCGERFSWDDHTSEV